MLTELENLLLLEPSEKAGVPAGKSRPRCRKAPVGRRRGCSRRWPITGRAAAGAGQSQPLAATTVPPLEPTKDACDLHMGAWWVGLQKGCQTLPSLQNRNEEWKARLDMSRGKKAILETSKTATYLLIAPTNGANATTKAALGEKQPP